MTKIKMSENRNNNELNIVYPDFGEEIDDEIFLHYATKTSKNAVWFVCCVPGASSTNPSDSFDEITKRLVLFEKYFPNFECSPSHKTTGWYFKLETKLNSIFYVGSRTMLFSDNLMSPYIRETDEYLYVDNLIRIAPLWHIDPMIFHDMHIRNNIVMGDLNNPMQSINLTKAISIDEDTPLLEQYLQQEAIIQKNSENVLSIPTNLARNVPLPYSLISKLPNILSIQLLEKAFSQCVGRVPANLHYAKNLSNINHKTILNYCSQSDKQDILKNNGQNVVPQTIRQDICSQVEKFLNNASSDDKNDVEYIKRLEEIAQAIYLITGVEYKSCEDDEFDFSPSGMVNYEVAKENWLNHIKKNNCDLTPCYDLIALIVKYKGYVPGKEECIEATINWF